MMQKGVGMKQEFSAGAVLYTHKDGKIKYVIITERSGHSGFPKGHIERGEDKRATAIREIREETGVEATLVGDFIRDVEYMMGARARKRVTYFLAEYNSDDPLSHPSDIRAINLLDFEDAYNMLTHDNSKAILKSANEYIKTNT